MTGMLTAEHPAVDTNERGALVLVVEPDSHVAQCLERRLTTGGYRVERATDGLQALGAFRTLAPDVVLLDVRLPVLDGMGVARQLRGESGVPILMFGAGETVDDRVAGLDAGADDFLIEPFASEELLARVRAVLRGRALAAQHALASARLGTLTYADVRIDQDTREAWRGERRLELRNKAFELLACFVRQPERVLGRRELLEQAWGFEFLGDSNVIEVTVGHVRQALEAEGESRLIHTVRPVGYILRASRELAAAPSHAPDYGSTSH